jgi:A/G-specific adenine glycosylase
VAHALWRIAESRLPDGDIEAYTQGLMDLGARVCLRSRPLCLACPVADDCIALQTRRVRELPAARPRKALPERSLVVLVVKHHGRILFERRPDTGIWSGLWSLPEAPFPLADAEEWVLTRHALHARDVQALAPVKHGFTHFALTMYPVRLEVDAPPSAREEGHRWMTRDDAEQAALPSPIKRIVRALG